MSDKNRLRRAVQAEKAVARDVAGRRTIASGSQQGTSNKGDVRASTFLIEVKNSKGPRYSLTLLTWRTIEGQAIRAGREPAMVLDLAGRKLAVIDYNLFLTLAGRDGTEGT